MDNAPAEGPTGQWPEPPEKLVDCARHGAGSGSELIIAEGDSAADLITANCDRTWQAVMPVQGKPMNAAQASALRVRKNVQLAAVRDAIGAGWDDPDNDQRFDAEARRYDRVVLLFDPDPDGTHSRALLLLFFHQWMKPLLDLNLLFTCRPPLWEFTSPRLATPVAAYTDHHANDLRTELDAKGVASAESVRFRGIASMSDETLSRTCLSPETRILSPLTSTHAESALASFARLKAQ